MKLFNSGPKGGRHYLKLFVIESPVFSLLEEVGVAVAVLQRVVDVVGDALPVGDGLRVAVGHGGSLLRVESVILVTLKVIKRYKSRVELNERR